MGSRSGLRRRLDIHLGGHLGELPHFGPLNPLIPVLSAGELIEK